MKVIINTYAMTVLFCFFTYTISFAQLDSSHLEKIDYLSPLEKGIVSELNKARTSPSKYAAYLKGLRQYYDGNLLKMPGKVPIRTSEGIKALDEAISYMSTARPVVALKVSQGMSYACRDHVKDQGSTNKTGHQGSDRSSSSERLNRYGQWQTTTGENISYGFDTAQAVVAQLIIDDGVSSRGHRKNIFTPQFHVCGVACGPHAYFRQMCVITFADGYREGRQGILNYYKKTKNH